MLHDSFGQFWPAKGSGWLRMIITKMLNVHLQICLFTCDFKSCVKLGVVLRKRKPSSLINYWVIICENTLIQHMTGPCFSTIVRGKSCLITLSHNIEQMNSILIWECKPIIHPHIYTKQIKSLWKQHNCSTDFDLVFKRKTNEVLIGITIWFSIWE